MPNPIDVVKQSVSNHDPADSPSVVKDGAKGLDHLLGPLYTGPKREYQCPHPDHQGDRTVWIADLPIVKDYTGASAQCCSVPLTCSGPCAACIARGI